MGHIKNYMIAKKAMAEYFRKEKERAESKLKLYEACFGNPDCWDNELACYRLMEDGRNMSQCGVVTEGDVKGARDFLEKYLPKRLSLWSARLEAADRAGKMIELNMHISWGRQRIGCGRPKCEAWLFFEDAEYGSRSAYGVGTASGCGYDLRSAAMQEALDFKAKKGDDADDRISKSMARASLDRFVIEHRRPLWLEYAVDLSPLPHLSISGKGANVFTSLFRKIGCKSCRECAVKDYLIDYMETSDRDDVYHVIRKDRI